MEKNNLFSIGDVAKMFHLSVGTLRHYEKMGLLAPEYIDVQTGYRYYSTKQFEVLNTIRYLRVLDTPLPQIVELLKDRDVEHMKELLYQQKQMVVQKKNELEIIEKKIDRRLQQAIPLYSKSVTIQPSLLFYVDGDNKKKEVPRVFFYETQEFEDN